MAKKFVKGTELVQAGFANGISTKHEKKGEGGKLSDKEKLHIINTGYLETNKFFHKLKMKKTIKELKEFKKIKN